MPVTHWDALDTTVPELEKVTYSIGSVSRVVLRVDVPPFDNVEVRRAMMIGTDMRKFMTLYRAPAEPLHVWPVHPDHSTYIPLEELPADIQILYDYNPTLAKQMIIDAGFPDGIETTYLTTSEPMALDQVVLLKDQWAMIGVEVEIEVVDAGAYADLVYPFPTPKWLGMRPDGTMTSDPSIILDAVYRTGAGWNYSVYSNPTLDELNRKASVEMDVTERNRLFSEGLNIIMRDVASIPLVSAPGRAYWWPWVKNYYGEVTIGDDGMFSGLAQLMWIDQDLKTEMGY